MRAVRRAVRRAVVRALVADPAAALRPLRSILSAWPVDRCPSAPGGARIRARLGRPSPTRGRGPSSRAWKEGGRRLSRASPLDVVVAEHASPRRRLRTSDVRAGPCTDRELWRGHNPARRSRRALAVRGTSRSAAAGPRASTRGASAGSAARRAARERPRRVPCDRRAAPVRRARRRRLHERRDRDGGGAVPCARRGAAGSTS